MGLSCGVEGCERENYAARGLCWTHYRRLMRTGTTDDPVDSQLPPFWELVARGGPDDCWPYNGPRYPSGYGRYRKDYAHRLAWELTHGTPPLRAYVCHTCDNPPCVNPAHLYLGDASTNVADRVARGRSARGAGHGRSKLIPEQVDAMRAEYASGEWSQVALSRKYGISDGHANKILRGTRWRT